MTGHEYKQAIARLDLTPVAAARFLGVDDTTSRRWITDRNPIPQPVAMLLEVMVKKNMTPHSVVALMKRK